MTAAGPPDPGPAVPDPTVLDPAVLDPAVLDAALLAAGFSESARPLRPAPDGRLLAAAPPSADTRSVLVVAHPGGGRTFHLPAPPTRDDGAVPSGPDELAFVLPTDVAAAGQTAAGAAGAAVAATLLDVDLGDLAGRTFAEAYADLERAQHPYVLRRVDATAEQPFDGPDAGDAAAFAGKRVLLFVHGIFSTCRTAFGALPAPFLQQLSESYDAVLGFDHPTVSVDPVANVAWLRDRLQGAAGATLDVITHSRGGLVARELAIQAAGNVSNAGDPGDPGVTIGRIAFVGTPNAGTEIVDPRQWGSLIDRFANLAGDLPGGAAVVDDFLAGVFELLKAAAFAVTDAFPGLECMLPGSPFLDHLSGSPARVPLFYAIDSDFRPWNFLLEVFAVKREFLGAAEVVVDHVVFGGDHNDVAVPTDSVGLGRSGVGFPVPAARSHTYGSGEHVWHCGYFREPDTVKRLTAWFTGEDG